MFVIINGDEYRENDIVVYNNAYGSVKGRNYGILSMVREEAVLIIFSKRK